MLTDFALVLLAALVGTASAVLLDFSQLGSFLTASLVFVIGAIAVRTRRNPRVAETVDSVSRQQA
jgi:hypothetical protein